MKYEKCCDVVGTGAPAVEGGKGGKADKVDDLAAEELGERRPAEGSEGEAKEEEGDACRTELGARAELGVELADYT